MSQQLGRSIDADLAKAKALPGIDMSKGQGQVYRDLRPFAETENVPLQQLQRQANEAFNRRHDPFGPVPQVERLPIKTAGEMDAYYGGYRDFDNPVYESSITGRPSSSASGFYNRANMRLPLEPGEGLSGFFDAPRESRVQSSMVRPQSLDMLDAPASVRNMPSVSQGTGMSFLESLPEEGRQNFLDMLPTSERNRLYDQAGEALTRPETFGTADTRMFRTQMSPQIQQYTPPPKLDENLSNLRDEVSRIAAEMDAPKARSIGGRILDALPLSALGTGLGVLSAGLTGEAIGQASAGVIKQRRADPNVDIGTAIHRANVEQLIAQYGNDLYDPGFRQRAGLQNAALPFVQKSPVRGDQSMLPESNMPMAEYLLTYWPPTEGPVPQRLLSQALRATPGGMQAMSPEAREILGYAKGGEVAEKTNPSLWAQAKSEAKGRMGGKHSARAMQLATQIYKKRGGGYKGKKPSAKSNSLKKWGKQKWKWSGGDKPGQGGKGVYLPKKKVERLKSTAEGRKKLAKAGAKKAKATREGKQYSKHGLAAGTSMNKGSEVLKRVGVSGYNKPKRTPNHPTKSHVVVARSGGQTKTIRFGQQGVKTNQTAGQRKAFKSRHAKNISRGPMSAAYWANKVKWSPSKTKDKANQKWVKGS